MNQQIPENFKVSPFMAGFVIVAMQVGVGVLGFQRLVAKEAGHDAWISVIIAALGIHLIVMMMYKICETVEGDVLVANVYAFGKLIGNSINCFFIFYFALFCTTVLAGLIEVIRVWMFPELEQIIFGSIFLILVIYIVSGGFRTVVGIAFLGITIPSYLLFSFAYAARHGDYTNLLPILDHTPIELAKSAYQMSLSFLGYGSLLFFYPFIKKPKESKKWVHLGLLITAVSYIVLTIITLAYFPADLLQKSIWPTLEMWKIVRLPFIERFEYLGIANWALIVLPNVAIALWIASRIPKQVFRINQRKVLYLIAIVVLAAVTILDTREKINLLYDIGAKLGFVVTYAYTPVLFLIVLLKKKVKSK